MKHVPLRTCIVTREKKPKNELARFVVDPISGMMVLDTTGKAKSRGANLSLDLGIYDRGSKEGFFERALKIKITEDNYAAVRKDFENYLKKREFRDGRKKVSVRIKGEGIKLE